MKILKKEKCDLTIEEGDSLSCVARGRELVEHVHKGEKKKINWVAIFELETGICGGFFEKEPK